MTQAATEEKLETKDDVDAALKRLVEIEVEVSDSENALNEAITKLKETVEEKVSPLRLEKKKLEASVIGYAKDHKADFVKRRTQKFTFGELSFRVSTKFILPSMEVVVEGLKKLGLDKYVITTETVKKEELKSLDNNVLAKLGAERKTEDNFSIKLDLKSLRKDN